MLYNRIDLIGKKFGKLTAVEYLGVRKYKCECECGNTKVFRADCLRYGKVLDCGCSNRYGENIVKAHKARSKFYWFNNEFLNQRQIADRLNIPTTTLSRDIRKLGFENAIKKHTNKPKNI